MPTTSQAHVHLNNGPRALCGSWGAWRTDDVQAVTCPRCLAALDLQPA